MPIATKNLVINHNDTRYEFFNIGPDQFGKWMLSYWRDETRCAWPILNEAGRTLKFNERKPLGGELLHAIRAVIDRKLTNMEIDGAYQIKVES